MAIRNAVGLLAQGRGGDSECRGIAATVDRGNHSGAPASGHSKSTITISQLNFTFILLARYCGSRLYCRRCTCSCSYSYSCSCSCNCACSAAPCLLPEPPLCMLSLFYCFKLFVAISHLCSPVAHQRRRNI